MRKALAKSVGAGLLCVVANASCVDSRHVTVSHPAVTEAELKSIHQPTPKQRALGIFQPYSDADIDFRIVVGQTDEIRSMQQWLADRSLPVPDSKSTRMHMKMNGVEHDMLMPGMLSDEEMAELDKARGADFDRLFLQGMIRHHQGAIDMVNDLFKAYGAAQDDTIYKFASDVFADQSIEIGVMHKMLGDQ